MLPIISNDPLLHGLDGMDDIGEEDTLESNDAADSQSDDLRTIQKHLVKLRLELQKEVGFDLLKLRA